MQIAKKVIEKQQQVAQKAQKERLDRLNGHTEKLIAFLSNENLTVEDLEDVLSGMLEGIKRSRIIRAEPITEKMNKQQFKEFYAESIAPKNTEALLET